MTLNDLQTRIHQIQQRIAQMQHRIGESPSPQEQWEIMATAFQELNFALEELQVANEELHAKNEELLLAHQQSLELFEFAPDAYLVTNTSGVIQQANRAAATLLNDSQEFLSGKSLVLYLVQQEQQAFDSKLLELGQMDGGQEWEVPLQPPNKTPITAAVTVTTVRNAEGTPLGFRWILRDITERKRIESELHKTNDRFQLVAAASAALIYDWDIENRTVDRTQGLVNILDYRPNEAEPTPSWWTQHIHPDDRERVRNTVKAALTNGESYELEYRILDKSDRYRYVWDKGLILRNAAGKAVRIVGCTADITDRKQTEEALRESEQRLQAILDNTPMSVFLKDLQGRYLMVNRQCASDLQLTPEQILGKTDYEVLPQALAEQFEVTDQQVLASQTPLVTEKQIQAEDGLNTCLVTKFPLFNATGVPYAVCGICTDITKRKRAEEAVQQLNQELENRVRERTAELEHLNEQLQNEIAEHQQTLNALRLSEEQFRQLAENIREVFWMVSEDRAQVIYISPAYEEIWGRTCESLYQAPLSWMEAIHPDDRDRMAAVREQYKHGNYEQEYRIVRPDGTIRWIRDRSFPVTDSTGQVYRVVGIAEDITVAKQTQLALQESEEHLRVVVQNMPVLMDAFDAEENIIVWNGECERVTGYSASEIVNNPHALELLYPDAEYREQMTTRLKEMGNNFRDWEWKLACKDGQVKTISWFNISERFPIPGWKAWAVGVDITERKNAEEALRVSEERFRQLAENIREVFWMTTPDSSQTMYVSPAYEEMWGRTCESLYQDSMSWLEAVHPDDRDRVFAALEPLKAGEYDQEYRIVRPDGLVSWIRDRGFPVRDAQGRICCIAGIAEDITSQKLTEAEIEQALQRERELSELKSQFISIASHEFRTPLTTISTSAELLERYRHRFSQEKQLTHLHRIQTAVGQMAQLLDDVLLIGKAGAGKLEFNPTPVDLVQFCSDLVAELQLTVKTQHEITFTHQGDCTFAVQDASESNNSRLLSAQSLPLLDEKLLRHIFGNLLSNAIKYSPSGSTVHFKLTCLDERAIFQVQDQGIGIPLEDQPRLFESFHRASNVGTIQGTGLGLAIVKQCVELQGGQISLESVVGSGTTFTVNLPLNFGKRLIFRNYIDSV